jgi:hypothetical protein
MPTPNGHFGLEIPKAFDRDRAFSIAGFTETAGSEAAPDASDFWRAVMHTTQGSTSAGQIKRQNPALVQPYFSLLYDGERFFAARVISSIYGRDR